MVQQPSDATTLKPVVALVPGDRIPAAPKVVACITWAASSFKADFTDGTSQTWDLSGGGSPTQAVLDPGA